METFEGKMMHSSGFKGGSSDYKNKKVVVVGSGNSAHDISQACCKAGAAVTMIQRSPTWVLSLARVHKLLSSRYNEHTVSPFLPRAIPLLSLAQPAEESDLMSMSFPSTLFRTIGADALSLLAPMDGPLIASLSASGFRPTPPEPNLNILVLTIQRAGGFYINVGASELIASGAISVKSSTNLSISSINKNTVVFSDGEKLEDVDEIIFATGYENGRARTRKVFGDEVADSIESIWGFDGTGEIRGVWRRSGQDGFWVAAGAFWVSRYYSTLLALQIKAVEMGLVDL
jgi:Pyridine nucleotide-disulphide oxidoreductase/Flavin-binding monooxygenase-like